MTSNTSPNHPPSNQDRLRLRQLWLQLLSGVLIMAGALVAFFDVGTLIGGALMLSGLALLLLTPRV